MIRSAYRFIKKKLNKFYISPSIKALKTLPSGGEVCLLDIGAAGEVEPRWKPFIQFLNYTGVEPDERSRSTLLNKKNNYSDNHYYIRNLSSLSIFCKPLSIRG